MDDAFLSVITARHCKRSFLDRPVPRETLETVLRAAGHAPSSQNTQFWQVAVLTGAARDELSRRLCEDFDNSAPVALDYRNRPADLDQLYRDRGREADAGFYRAKGIEPVDKAARRARLRENYVFYGAPVEMIFHLPADATHGTFLEMGLFLQNVMLGLVACGLGSCPQGSVAAYPDTIRDFLGLQDRLIVCGLAVGYVEETAPINAFAPSRAELEAYTRWLDHNAPPTSGIG
jgi:nitroreductase